MEEASGEGRDVPYEELTAVGEKILKHDTLIMLGDFIGKIGKGEYFM